MLILLDTLQTPPPALRLQGTASASCVWTTCPCTPRMMAARTNSSWAWACMTKHTAPSTATRWEAGQAPPTHAISLW